MKAVGKDDMPEPKTVPNFDTDAFRSACSKCNLRELCLPGGLSQAELVRAAIDAAKESVLADRKSIAMDSMVRALSETRTLAS